MITLDTHIIIWNALQPEKISSKARKMIDQANEMGKIFIADISLWEIAMLMHKQRLVLDTAYAEFINLIRAANHYVFESITPEVADQLICATSIVRGAPLVTADSNLRAAKIVKTIW